MLRFEQLERWQRDNEHIHTGYLPPLHSFTKVLNSLGWWHNEIGNIYTHLVPGVLALAALFVADVARPQQLFFAGCAACLLMSATFHTLKSHSEGVMVVGNKLDYLGICFLIAASELALVGVAFANFQTARRAFNSLVILLGTTCAVFSLSDKFRARKFRPVRALVFVIYGLSGVLPVLYAKRVFGSKAAEKMGLYYLVWEAVLYISGAAIYAARLPERLSPGSFDYIGHSHQIFHVLVVIAAACHYAAMKAAMRAA